MAELFGSLNYIAIVVCMFASIAVGFVWYSPKTFFTIWWKGIGKGDTKPGSTNMVLVFGLTFVSSFVKCLGVAVAVALVSPWLGGFGVLNGLLIGFGAWLLLIAPTYLTNNLFSGFGPKVYLIEVGNHLVDFLIAGVILSLWR